MPRTGQEQEVAEQMADLLQQDAELLNSAQKARVRECRQRNIDRRTYRDWCLGMLYRELPNKSTDYGGVTKNCPRTAVSD